MQENERELALFAAYEDPHDFAGEFAMRGDLMACVREGDVELLRELLDQARFREQSLTVLDQGRARTVFLFVQAIALYEAVNSGVLLEKGCALALSYQRKLARLASVEEIISLMAQLLLDNAVLVRQSQLDGGADRRVRRCLEYIHEHIYEPISLQTLADCCQVSPVHLERLFLRQTGTTISAWLRREKIRRARILLQYTDLSCTEVGQRLNYSSQSYFARQFHQETGETPTHWRSRHQHP